MYDNNGGADVICSAQHELVANNTISVAKASPWALSRGIMIGYSVTVENNIVFFAQDVAIRASGPATYVVRYNCTFSNANDYVGTSPGVGSVTLPALFVDSAAHDYHLREGSPCIDAGDPDSSFNDPDGTRNDMGALVYTGYRPPATTAAATLDLNGDGRIDMLDVIAAVDLAFRAADSTKTQTSAFSEAAPTARHTVVHELIERLFGRSRTNGLPEPPVRH